MTLRISLMGASPHTGNRGVSALHASLARLIWRVNPEAQISNLVASRTPIPATARVDGTLRHIETVNYRLSLKARLGEQLWWILLLSVLYRLAPSTSVRKQIANHN